MIEVTGLHKVFRLYKHPADRLKEILLRKPYHHSHVALDQISFKVEPGETLGILGRNGAGKSTLLKLLNGVLLPDGGSIQVEGRITGLLELGTGFDPELSGRANIQTNGLLIGMTEAEIRAREEAIIDFSELGQFIEDPIRTYSSGMVMRLAFAIAIHADPSCFLVDEALSVGDGHFQQKCMRRIKEFRANGGSIIFVSHDLNAVKMVCDRALVLDEGLIVFEGNAEEAVNVYNKIMARMDAREESLSQQRQAQAHEYGNGKAWITGASLTGDASQSSTVSSGEQGVIRVQFRAKEALENVSVGFMIRDRFGQDIHGTNTNLLGNPLSLKPGHAYELCFNTCFNLGPGKYTVTLALHSEEHHLEECYHWCDNYLQFEVAGSHVPLFSGVVYLPTSTTLHEQPESVPA